MLRWLRSEHEFWWRRSIKSNSFNHVRYFVRNTNARRHSSDRIWISIELLHRWIEERPIMKGIRELIEATRIITIETFPCLEKKKRFRPKSLRNLSRCFYCLDWNRYHIRFMIGFSSKFTDETTLSKFIIDRMNELERSITERVSITTEWMNMMPWNTFIKIQIR